MTKKKKVFFPFSFLLRILAFGIGAVEALVHSIGSGQNAVTRARTSKVVEILHGSGIAHRVPTADQ